MHWIDKELLDLSTPNPLKAFDFGWNWRPDRKTIRGQEYAASPWVYACIQEWIKISTVPLKIKKETRKGKWEQVVSGPIYNRIARINPETTNQQFLTNIIGSLAINGNAYSYRGSPAGDAISLKPIETSRVFIHQVDRDSEGRIMQYEVRDFLGAGSRFVSSNELEHWMLPNVYDMHIGLSPIDTLRISIDSDFLARLHNKHLYGNSGRIQGLVIYDNVDHNDVQTKHKPVFDSAFTGGEAAGKWVHSSGIKDLKQLTQSMKDMDWVEGLKISRSEICSVYGVPPIMVQITADNKVTDYEQAKVALWTEKLIPLGDMIADQLSSALMPPGYKIYFDYHTAVPVLRGDMNAKVRQYQELITNGRLSPVEAARITGLDIGDTLEVHTVPAVQYNIVPAEDWLTRAKLATENAINQPQLGIADGQEDMEPAPNVEHEQLEVPKPPVQAPDPTKTIDVIAKGVAKAYKSCLFDLRSRSLSAVSDGATIKDILKLDVDMELVSKELIGAFAAGYRSVSDASPGDDARAECMRTVIAVAQNMLGTIRGRIIDNDDFSKDTIRASFAEMEQRKRDTAQAASRVVYQSGVYAAERDSGVQEHMWVYVKGCPMRRSHAELDRSVVAVGEPFVHDLMHPCDISGGTAKDLLCKCYTSPTGIDK